MSNLLSAKRPLKSVPLLLLLLAISMPFAAFAAATETPEAAESTVEGGEGSSTLAASKWQPEAPSPASEERDESARPTDNPAAGLLEVHFIDVGQGDSLFIRSPAGKTLLIDAGGPGAGPFVLNYLVAQGVESLDLAISSHPHLDHLGGMLEVLKGVRPKRYMDPAFPHPLPQYFALLAWLEAEGIPVLKARGGRRITIEEGLVLELLAPNEPFYENTRSDANANSIVARLSYGEHSFLFTGDAENVTERGLLKSNPAALKSTVLKVAHHGSRHSSSKDWLEAVSAEVAILSLGRTNNYGHPHPHLLERLNIQKVQVFRTDVHGDVIAKSDGKKLSWETTGEGSAPLDAPGGVSSWSGKGIPKLPPEKDKVNLNTASAKELMSVPGIGAAIADRIIQHRNRHGPFKTVASLTEVKGIGVAILQRVEGHLTVGDLEAKIQK